VFALAGALASCQTPGAAQPTTRPLAASGELRPTAARFRIPAVAKEVNDCIVIGPKSFHVGLSPAGMQQHHVLVVVLLIQHDDGSTTELSREAAGADGLTVDPSRFPGKKLRIVRYERPANGLSAREETPCDPSVCNTPGPHPPPPFACE
jgi:hypothetical protein